MKSGGILEKKGIILHQVNCMAVMGTGIALAIRTRWPKVFSEYRTFCQGKRTSDLLGEFQLVQVEDDVWVGNVFGQERYGRSRRQTDYDAVQESLIKMRVEIHPHLEHVPIWYPKMGCVNAGGDWQVVSRILDECLIGLSHSLVEGNQVILGDNQSKIKF